MSTKRTVTLTYEIETTTFEGVELVGVRGIRQLTGYGSAAISNLYARKAPGFPLPVINLGEDRGSIRLWRFDEIEQWWKEKNGR